MSQINIALILKIQLISVVLTEISPNCQILFALTIFKAFYYHFGTTTLLAFGLGSALTGVVVYFLKSRPNCLQYFPN